MSKPMNKTFILVMICVGTFLTPFLSGGLNLAIPSIGNEFKLSAVSLSLVLSLYLLSTVMFQIPFASVADRVGRTKVYLLGLLVFGGTALISGLATSGNMLILFRFLTGIGSAMTFGTSVAIISLIFDKSGRGKALGVLTAVTYLGAAIGPVLGGYISHYWGWRYIFFISAAISFMTYIGSKKAITIDWAVAKGQKINYKESAIYSLGILLLFQGLSWLPAYYAWIILVAGIALMLKFVADQLKKQNPLFDVRVFVQNKIFSYSCVAAMINYAATAGIIFLLSIYLQYVKNYNASEASTILVIQAVLQCIFSPIAGSLTDRVNSAYLATIGMIISFIGIVWLIFINKQTSIIELMANLAFLGIGFAIFSTPNINVIMGAVKKEQYTFASATIETGRLLGQSLSMTIVTIVIHVYLGSLGLNRQYNNDIMELVKASFIVFAVISLGGIYASIYRFGKKENKS